MLTEPMLRSIHALLPADDARSYALRRLVRFLARCGGEVAFAEACAMMGADAAPLTEARTWDGVRLTGCGLGATLALAPYVRRAVGLEVSANELLSDLGREEARALGDCRGPRSDSPAEDLLTNSAGPHAMQSARQAGYDSDPCPRCHERRTVSSGDLHACDGCGHVWNEAQAPDPLAEVRAAVARAENVTTTAEAIAHADVRFRAVAGVLPRDCAGTAG